MNPAWAQLLAQTDIQETFLEPFAALIPFNFVQSQSCDLQFSIFFVRAQSRTGKPCLIKENLLFTTKCLRPKYVLSGNLRNIYSWETFASALKVIGMPISQPNFYKEFQICSACWAKFQKWYYAKDLIVVKKDRYI